MSRILVLAAVLASFITVISVPISTQDECETSLHSQTTRLRSANVVSVCEGNPQRSNEGMAAVNI